MEASNSIRPRWAACTVPLNWKNPWAMIRVIFNVWHPPLWPMLASADLPKSAPRAITCHKCQWHLRVAQKIPSHRESRAWRCGAILLWSLASSRIARWAMLRWWMKPSPIPASSPIWIGCVIILRPPLSLPWKICMHTWRSLTASWAAPTWCFLDPILLASWSPPHRRCAWMLPDCVLWLPDCVAWLAKGTPESSTSNFWYYNRCFHVLHPQVPQGTFVSSVRRKSARALPPGGGRATKYIWSPTELWKKIKRST